MQVTRFAWVTFVGVALAATLGSGTVAGQSSADDATAKKVAAQPAPAARLATLGGVKAVPMSAPQLDAVKGLTIHFTTPSQNEGHPHREGPPGPDIGWYFVNHKENNLGKGNALPISGPGYSGLCGAALNSPALTIPGQNTTTGAGGGC